MPGTAGTCYEAAGIDWLRRLIWQVARDAAPCLVRPSGFFRHIGEGLSLPIALQQCTESWRACTYTASQAPTAKANTIAAMPGTSRRA